MSEAPERIWAFYTPDDFDDTATITAYEMVQHGGKEYCRAEPTLSAAMELPEVRALKDERDAATAAYWRVRSYAVHDDDCTINRYPNRNACSCGLRAALAAIKEPKT